MHEAGERSTRTSRLRLVVVLLVTAVAVLGLLDHVVEASADDAPPMVLGSPMASTWMVGDSVTYLGMDDIEGRVDRPWRIIGIPGSLVSDMPGFIQDRLNMGPAPKRMVIALGTNAFRGWDISDFRQSLALLPASTVVVLIEPYRDPRFFEPGSTPAARDPALISRYVQMMRTLAAERPRTCVAPWRTWAQRHASTAFYGPDAPDSVGPTPGVHPLPWAQKAWARIVVQTVNGCQ